MNSCLPPRREFDILDVALQLREGRLCAAQLVESCFAVIERREPEIHAWVHVDRDAALAVARERDQEAASGHWRGVLHGIPIGVKDIIDIAGMPTRAGSPLRARHMATRDAAVVAQLRAAGAIILGKTVTTQFACFDPAETRNPVDAARTPGGSSSGSAAALAGGMCLGALGTQTGGSVIRPAAYCGVTGMKPTLDAWSTQGIVPVSFHLDHVGPMGRSTRDLACLWWGDKTVGELQVFGDASSRMTPPVLYLPDAFWQEPVTASVKTVAEAAVAKLAARGARIRPVAFPDDLHHVLAMHRRIMAVEAAEYHRQAYQDHADAFAPNLAGLIEQGLAISSVEYAAALKHRREFTRVLREKLQPGATWLTPATTTVAPTRDSTGNPAFNSPWSYCGFPALCFPAGTAESLPIGIQLIGPPAAEAPLLQTALWCEAVVGRAENRQVSG